jgi:hypothetical protein
MDDNTLGGRDTLERQTRRRESERASEREKERLPDRVATVHTAFA